MRLPRGSVDFPDCDQLRLFLMRGHTKIVTNFATPTWCNRFMLASPILHGIPNRNLAVTIAGKVRAGQRPAMTLGAKSSDTTSRDPIATRPDSRRVDTRPSCTA